MITTRRMLTGSFAAMGLLASKPGRAQPPSAWDRIAATKVLRVGLIPNRPPYQWKRGGEQQGLAIQMGKDVAEALGQAMGSKVEIEYVTSSWATIVLDIQSASVDVFFGIVDSEERRKAIAMFGPIYAVPVIMVDAKGFAPGQNWTDYDTPATSIAVTMGTSDEAAARAFLTKAKLRSFKSLADAVLDVQSGNSSALVTSILVGMDAKQKNPSFAHITLPHPVQSAPSGGATWKDRDGRLATFLQGWAEQYRSSGRAQTVIMDAIKTAGLPTDQLPPDVRF